MTRWQQSVWLRPSPSELLYIPTWQGRKVMVHVFSNEPSFRLRLFAAVEKVVASYTAGRPMLCRCVTF